MTSASEPTREDYERVADTFSKGVFVEKDAPIILSALRLAAGKGWRPISEAPKGQLEMLCRWRFGDIGVAVLIDGVAYSGGEPDPDQPAFVMPLDALPPPPGQEDANP